ncbi:MAG: hypothetical protein R2795_18570 [Saprospiraceae bacterium]
MNVLVHLYTVFSIFVILQLNSFVTAQTYITSSFIHGGSGTETIKDAVFVDGVFHVLLDVQQGFPVTDGSVFGGTGSNSAAGDVVYAEAGCQWADIIRYLYRR